MTKNARFSVIVIILLLSIGFAAVTTNLIINSVAQVGVNQEDFDVYFLTATPEPGGSASISENRKVITYSTKVLSMVGDEAVLDYTVINNSSMYDARVNVSVNVDNQYNDYFSISTTTFNDSSNTLIEAKKTKDGKVTIRLLKPILETQEINFTITLDVDAEERSTIAEAVVTNSRKSIYSWSEIPFLSNNITDTVDTLGEYGIKDVYQTIQESDFADYKGLYENMISTLNNSGIDTYFLVGVPSAYNDLNRNKNYIDMASSYNASVSTNKQVKGVVFDIEPYLNDTYQADPIQGFKEYADTFEQVYAYAKSKNLRVILVIPYWYDISYQDSKYTEEQRTLASQTFDRLFTYCDRISVMNYYKTNMVNAISNELTNARTNGIEIESIVNMIRPDEGDKTTVWVDENSLDVVDNYWQGVMDEYDYDRLFYSYHDLISLLELENKYVKYTFKYVDSTGTELSGSGDKTITFSSGDTYFSTAKKSITIPKDLTFTMTLSNYLFNSMTINDIGDNTKEVVVTVSEFSKNTLEVYAKLYTPDKSSYSSITGGTITLRNTITNDTSSKDIRSGGYYIFSNISSTIPYEVTIVIDGKTYYLENATATNDSNEVLSIIDSNKNLVIPEGIKANKYVAPTMYFIER